MDAVAESEVEQVEATRVEPEKPAFDPARILEEIEAQERVVADREYQLEDAQERAKAARKAFDTEVSVLRSLIRRHSKGDAPLFNQPADGFGGTVTITTGALPAPAPSDDAWRSVPLDTLEPKIAPKKLELLAEHEPPIINLGQLVDWQAAKGDPWWWKDVKGLGQGGMEQIAAACEAYWIANPRPEPAKPAPVVGPPVSAEKAARMLGLTGDDALSDAEYAALRTGEGHASRVITATTNVTESLVSRGMAAEDLGDFKITDRGFAALGYQPQLDAEIAKGK